MTPLIFAAAGAVLTFIAGHAFASRRAADSLRAADVASTTALLAEKQAKDDGLLLAKRQREESDAQRTEVAAAMRTLQQRLGLTGAPRCVSVTLRELLASTRIRSASFADYEGLEWHGVGDVALREKSAALAPIAQTLPPTDLLVARFRGGESVAIASVGTTHALVLLQTSGDIASFGMERALHEVRRPFSAHNDEVRSTPLNGQRSAEFSRLATVVRAARVCRIADGVCEVSDETPTHMNTALLRAIPGLFRAASWLGFGAATSVEWRHEGGSLLLVSEGNGLYLVDFDERAVGAERTLQVESLLHQSTVQEAA